MNAKSVLAAILISAPSCATEPSAPKAPQAAPDPLPTSAVARFGSLAWRHPLAVGASALSPDGARAVTSGGDPSTAVLWNARDGRRIATLGMPEPFSVHTLWFGHDGSALFGLKNRESIVVWDGSTGRFLREWKAGDSSVMALAPGWDGTTLLAAHRDKSLVLWDLETGRVLKRFETPAEESTAVALSPDGQSALTGDAKGGLLLWNAESGAVLRTFRGHEQWINSVSFHPGGKWALSGSLDSTVRLWDIGTGRVERSFEPHPWRVATAGFSPDGSLVAAAFLDGTVRTWESAGGRALATFQGTLDPGQIIPFSADGRGILSIRSRTLTWTDARSGEQRPGSPGNQGAVLSLAWSPDGTKLVTGGEEGDSILWRAAGGAPERVFAGHHGPVVSVTFLPDGKTFLSASGDRTLGVWDVGSGTRLRTMAGHEGQIALAALSHDGRLALSAGGEGQVLLWDVAAGKTVVDGKQAFDAAALAFRGHDQALLSRPDGSVVRWPLAGNKLDEVLPKTDQSLTSSAFGLDGLRIVRVLNERSLTVWDAERGSTREIQEKGASIRSVALSPDASLVAVGKADGGIDLRDTVSGKLVERFSGGEGSVVSLAFSPGGRLLASGSEDATALAWHLGYGHREKVRAWLDEWTKGAESRRASLLETALADLGSPDPERWVPAREVLFRVGDPVIAAILPKEAKELTEAAFAELVLRLDADAPDERSKAAEELVAFGRQVLPRISRALEGAGLGAETRGRLEAVQSRLDRSLNRGDLGRLRAVLLLLELPRTEAVRRALGRFALSPGNTWGEELAIRNR